MSTIMKELKAEISKLSRREIKRNLTPIKRITAAQRGRIAALRREVSALLKDVAVLKKALAKTAAIPGVKTDAESVGRRFWITGKGIRSLRKRLGLTQAGFAQLAGVSNQAVVMWERNIGKIPLRRRETAAKLQAMRKLTKRAVRELVKPSRKSRKKS